MSVVKALQGLKEANPSVSKLGQIEGLLAKIKGSIGQDPNFVANVNVTTALDRVYTSLMNVATFIHQNVSATAPVRTEGFSNPNRGSPILPIGTVNLTTGANQMFGMVFDGWEEGSGTNLLVQANDYPGQMKSAQMRVIHTSGSGSEYGIGDPIQLAHDQTRRPIGDGWTIAGVFPHTKEGLLQLKQKSGKSSLPFATFK
jgi:hypothetical protein